MLLIPLSIIIQFLLFNKIGKLNIIVSLLISLYRTGTSYFYTSIFPVSDLTLIYVNTVKDCTSISQNYTKNFFFFTSPANRIYCTFPNISISELNLLYSTFAALFLSLFIFLIFDPNLFFNKNSINSFEIYKIKNGIPFLGFLFDPSIAIFTSAIGKDVLHFSFYISIIIFLIRFNFRSLIYLAITTIFINFSRPYVFLFASLALLISLFLPDILLIKSFKPIRALIKFSVKTKKLYVSLIILIIPLLIYVLINYLSKVRIDSFSYQAFKDAFEYLSIGPGGTFAYPEGTPLIIKYFFFWILPFPGIQTFIPSFIFGFSTLFLLYFIYKIFTFRLILNKYVLKFIFSSILLFSILFGLVSNNSGLTIRYRTISIAPAIYLLYHISLSNRLSELHNKITS